jgi:outer membrane lipoprotein-sorting protein
MRRVAPTRRGFAALALALAAWRPTAAALPPGQEAWVNSVEAYLNGITTLAADFRQQSAADGALATGKLFIDRTRGAMRFDYDPPSKLLLVAPGDWRLIFYDGSIQQVNVIPLAETPLGFLLEDEVRLEGEVAVEGVRETEAEVDLALVRTDAPDQGRVVLTLARRPIELRRWSVVDAQGLTTRIELTSLRTGVPLDRGLFVWRDPKMFGFPSD